MCIVIMHDIKYVVSIGTVSWVGGDVQMDDKLHLKSASQQYLTDFKDAIRNWKYFLPF